MSVALALSCDDASNNTVLFFSPTSTKDFVATVFTTAVFAEAGSEAFTRAG